MIPELDGGDAAWSGLIWIETIVSALCRIQKHLQMRYPDMKRIALLVVTLALIPDISLAAEGTVQEAAQQAAQGPQEAKREQVQEPAREQESVGQVYWASGKVLVALGRGEAREVLASVPLVPD